MTFAVDSTDVLKPKDIRLVHDHLWPARHKWRRIGMAVEIDPTTLEVIQMDNHRTDDCFNDVLTKWLRNNKPLPCWKNITTGLQSIEIKVLLGMSLIFILSLQYTVLLLKIRPF
jgi:hypothetical protein